MQIKLANLKLKNPVILASGTFDKNITKKIDISKLGAIVTKTITLRPRAGNPPPHIIKTNHGFLNSVGLKNSGIKKYLARELPFWQKFDTEIIPSIGGEKENDYLKLAEILDKQKIKALEINISCPNLDRGGMAFGIDPKTIKRLITKIRHKTKKILMVKLSPNVTSIVEIADACLNAGIDILSIANTYLGLEINNKKKKSIFHRVIAGYSGPAIKPLSLRAVWQVYKKFNCPIIGGGGIENFDDAMDYIMCGASTVSIGSANYQNPKVAIEIVRRFENYFKKNNIEKIRGII